MNSMERSGNQKYVLIVVDDDLDIQSQVMSYFSPDKFEVICFSSAQDAIDSCTEKKKEWDVLLTNFHFPTMTGVDFTIEIQKILPDLPIILLSPLDATDIAVLAIQKGAYDFIVKPIHSTQLQIAVERALQLKFLKEDLFELKSKVKISPITYGKIIGRSPQFIKVLDLARRVATSNANVFISGESGTGKEVLVKFIHDESLVKNGPFIAINCSAIPESLLESELFGHAKGAFSGAIALKIGLFEEAQNGTLFLDEIGDLSLSLQAKLLRVLQERIIRRVGENHVRKINCRIITATHKDLLVEIAEKRFREDVFFRLNVIPITIPPLRERIEDIVPLAEAFLRKYAIQNNSLAKTFSKEVLNYILHNPWRGNVRELENAVERAVILSNVAQISLENFLPQNYREVEIVKQELPNSNLNLKLNENEDENVFQIKYLDQLPTLDDVIQKFIEFAVCKNGGAKDKTAKDIGIDRKTLYKRFKNDILNLTESLH
ncbi:MAG: sigma-54 dependent transcriptional regulator [Bacteriovoracaceae bacterium]|nr:sigma-54 dependent transcriptional regulator [Bacteriovoracaceae bacterium]